MAATETAHVHRAVLKAACVPESKTVAIAVKLPEMHANRVNDITS